MAREYGLNLNQGQYDALVSVVYNLGPGVLNADRSLGGALRRHNMQAAADAILLYDKAGGRTLPGLTRRRRAERAMFLAGESKGDRLRAELARIRAKVRKVGGWGNVSPLHYWYRRAVSIKKWLAMHPDE